jgi:protein tyrosine/serine phosphatase
MRCQRLLSLALVLAALAVASDPSLVHVRNLGKVNEHLLRGAEPDAVALQELGASGVKLVIDLREEGNGPKVERARAEKLGMRYVNVPFPPLSAPSPEQVGSVLKLLTENSSVPIFVHCRRGKDRTGTVIACYRIQHDGWDNEKALAEAKSYGMSAAERGMRQFVLHFTPLTMDSAPFSGK